MNFQDRVAVVTGATGGSGRAVARRLAQAGASLALFSSSEAKLGQLAAEIGVAQERWLTRALDFTDPGAARIAAEATMEKFGRVDMLLHFIGGWVGGKTVIEFGANQFEEMLQQHLWTTLYLSQAFAPLLSANGWGRIVVISSPSAALPASRSAPYAVAKAAQETLILALAQELKHTGVTANILRVKTIDVEHVREAESTPTNASWTIPEEIAEAVVYLCSDEAKVVNGARIPLYGGP
jgi:NAD(P)-dependent dehydrogenase (short-subunit alcohol dehydrogenase family)